MEQTYQDRITDLEEANATLQAKNDELEKQLFIAASNLLFYYQKGLKEGMRLKSEVICGD